MIFKKIQNLVTSIRNKTLFKRLGFREIQVFKALGTGFLSRGILIVANFLTTALLVRNLGAKDGYGVYITITAIVGWLQLSNLGFGMALQNLLIDAVAKKDIINQKKLVATTQLSLLTICLLVGLSWSIFYFVGTVNWTALVKGAAYAHANEISKSIYVSGIFVILSILISYVAPIYAAHQKLHRYQLWVLVSQLSGFVGLLFAVVFKQTLLGFVLLCQGLPIVVFMINALWIAFKHPTEYVPCLKSFSAHHLKAIMTLGLSFSVIGLTGALQYGLDNIIIARTVGASHIAPYAITQKLFNVFQLFTGFLFMPMWAAFGNAISCDHWDWVLKRFKQMKYLVIGSYILFLGAALVGGKLFIRIWVGSDVTVSLLLILLVGLYILTKIWVDTHSIVYNALNKIRTNAMLSLPGGLISAGSMLIGATYWGINGMVIGMALAMGLWGGILSPYLVQKELKLRYDRFINSSNNLQ